MCHKRLYVEKVCVPRAGYGRKEAAHFLLHHLFGHGDIMTVADVFDALISKRCYKDPMPLEKAYAIIREESGTHFDSEIVEAFFAVTDKIEAIAANE